MDTNDIAFMIFDIAAVLFILGAFVRIWYRDRGWSYFIETITTKENGFRDGRWVIIRKTKTRKYKKHEDGRVVYLT